MACALTSESRRLYSWLWDSHISPKNSKWLQENLTGSTLESSRLLHSLRLISKIKFVMMVFP
ncbi:hypothetical protein HanHA300_Chr09g0308091 [Helianthus annuus]|nr:hypothetical protein HanHA300_Chr09g0308091 [Helianthus annuus]